MAKFKRVSLQGSEEVFRPTQQGALEDTDEVITEVIDARKILDDSQRQFSLSQDEVDLLVEAIQASKYPSKARPPSLDKHERLDVLRAKLQGDRQFG